MPLPATTADQLLEAKAALHALLTGQSVVEVRDSSGDSVRYTMARVADLRAYISELETRLAGETGSTAGARRPMRMQF